jgi:hypothetical protein
MALNSHLEYGTISLMHSCWSFDSLDHCWPLHVLLSLEEEFTIIAIWVDDGLVGSTSNNVIYDIIIYLKNYYVRWKLRDNFYVMRSLPADCFAEMEIQRDRSRRNLYVNQATFISSILKRFIMESVHPRLSSADPCSRLTTSMSPTIKIKLFPWEESHTEKQ